MKKYLMILAAMVFFGNVQLFGAKKTIHVIPDHAKIYLNGSEVGNGMYAINFGKDDFVILKFEAPGYISKQVKLFKNNPNKTVSYQLAVDEAEQNSVGSGDGIDLADKWFDVTCKKGMTEDLIWKRLMNIATSNFENIEIRDKSAGWIKTAWAISKFTYQIVRTKLEIKISLGSDDEITYKVRISSQIADNDCGLNDQCFTKYPRVLKKYEQVINDLQNSIGSNF